MVRHLIIKGKRYIEWTNDEPRPIGIRSGPPDYYRDGNGDVRVHAVDGQNHIVAAGAAEGGE